MFHARCESNKNDGNTCTQNVGKVSRIRMLKNKELDDAYLWFQVMVERLIYDLGHCYALHCVRSSRHPWMWKWKGRNLW